MMRRCCSSPWRLAEPSTRKRMAALGRVLHGVGEQVHEDLAQPPLVADEPVVLDLVHFHGEHLVFGVGLLAHHGLDGFHGAGEGEGACCQGGLAGLDLRHVQHVVDEPQKVLAGGGDLAVVVAHVGGVVGLAVDERGEAQDGVHGRADVVAHGGEERAFGAVGVLGGGGGALEAGADLVVGGDVGEREDGLLALGEHHGPRRHAQPLRAAQRRVVRLEFPGARLIAGAGVHDGGHVGVGLVGRQLVGDEEVAGRNAEDVLGVFEDGFDQALLAVDDEDGGVDVGADGRVHALDILLVAMLAAAPVHYEGRDCGSGEQHCRSKGGGHLVGDADDFRAVGFHHRKWQNGHERPAVLCGDGGVEDELLGSIERHDEAAAFAVGGDALKQLGYLRVVSVGVGDDVFQAAAHGVIGAAVGIQHDGAGGVDDEGGAGAGIGGAIGVLQLIGGVGDVDGAEDVVGAHRCGGRSGAGGNGRLHNGGVEEDAALAGVAEVHLRGAGLAGHGRAEQLLFQGRVVQVGFLGGAPGGTILGANPCGGRLVGGDEVLYLVAGLLRGDVGDEVGEALHGVLVGGETFVQVVGAGRCQLHDRGGCGVAHEGLDLPEVEQARCDGDGGEDGHDDQSRGHDLTAVYFDGVHDLPFLAFNSTSV